MPQAYPDAPDSDHLRRRFQTLFAAGIGYTVYIQYGTAIHDTMDEQPTRNDSRPAHWYTVAAPVEDAQPLAPPHKRGVARERMRRRREDKAIPAPNWTWGILAIAIVGVIGAISLIVLTASNPRQATPIPATPIPFGAQSTPLQPTLPAIRAWDGKQRYTVLVMGLDKRPGEEGSGFRTDSLILISIDPATQSVGMLSIPRDLYVPIPLPKSNGMQPINTAYVLGELDRLGSGPKMTMQTVQYNFGIPVNSYVVVSFETVINLVDAIGGVDITVPQAIDDPEYPDMYYGFEPLHIPAGTIHMNGQLALKYARTRHQTDDFDRAKRQQQVILAVRQRILKPDVLPGIVGQAPTLWNQLSKGVLTDLTLDQALGLAWYVKDIPAENIKRGTVGDKYVQAIQYNGDTVLTPNRAIIAELLTQVFGADYSR